jgi:phospholipid/cholesterol/gamma-HCH transport system substrate-binding protein
VAAPSNHWKLGLFVVAGVALGLATLVFLGAQSLNKEGVSYWTYFDESVQGLEVGSPVKFRGVTIGHVEIIDVAEDRRHVGVSCNISVSDLDTLGLNKSSRTRLGFGFRQAPAKIDVPSDLLMQIGSAGITGVKFILIDFFDVKDNPAPHLPFGVPENYIPAAPSTMKNLEDAVVKALNRFPEIAEEILATLKQAHGMLEQLDREGLSDRASATITRMDDVLKAAKTGIDGARVGKLSAKAEEALDGLNGSMTRLNGVLARVDGERGLLASTQRATDSIGDLAGGARGLGAELTETLRDFREAVDSVERVTDALDTDSDMLLKGRTQRKQ